MSTVTRWTCVQSPLLLLNNKQVYMVLTMLFEVSWFPATNGLLSQILEIGYYDCANIQDLPLSTTSFAQRRSQRDLRLTNISKSVIRKLSTFPGRFKCVLKDT